MTQRDTGPVDAGRGRTEGPGRGEDERTRAAASARRWLRLFLLGLVGALLTTGLVLPWKVLALVLSLFALTAGVVALVKALAAKMPRLVVLTTSIGLVGALFLAVGTGASVLLWPVTKTYEDCMARALTLRAESDCRDGLTRLDGLG
ncbi:hypothetical protein PTW37_04220 [Arthrobacter agilis]|uniref:hypothetical protein n=1 Tax=Arthrobacter agilis TaxID=37921 RepID=UPI0023659116|nr:hypothetical protein [Arthrobacter agilis]WDF34143.1 hypothetical protein PTW37_04220 [Arthrobacter agilis]